MRQGMRLFVLDWQTNQFRSFEETKQDLIYDIRFNIEEQTSELQACLNNEIKSENLKKSIEWYQQQLDKIKNLKEDVDGYGYLYHYIHNDRRFEKEVFSFDNVVTVNDKKFGILNDGDATTNEEEFRAENYKVYDLSNSEQYEYQFVERFDEVGTVNNMEWHYRKYSGTPLDNDPNLFWHDWESVDLSSNTQQTICNEIINIDNKKLFKGLKFLGLRLAKDDGEKIIENAWGDKFSPIGYCGDILLSVCRDALLPDMPPLKYIIENDLKPVVEIVKKLNAGYEEFSPKDLKVLNDIDFSFNAGLLKYKGNYYDSTSIESKGEGLNKLAKLEALLEDSEKTTEKIRELIKDTKQSR